MFGTDFHSQKLIVHVVLDIMHMGGLVDRPISWHVMDNECIFLLLLSILCKCITTLRVGYLH